jgi:hypothetical protein
MADNPLSIAPDGLPILIPWGDFHVGESVFVPCINMTRARIQIGKIGAAMGFSLAMHSGVEAGMLGLRVWRTA